MQLLDIITNLAEKKIDELQKSGHINNGHNGPYYDEETPVRNTAHWAVTFSVLYNIFKEEKYYKALEKCGEYLLSKEARPMNATFYCRKNPNKDFSNGTIGQAWAIEGLAAAYSVTRNEKFIEIAKEVFLLHPFDWNYNLWKIVNVDGSYRGFDFTFNHQLWFAASGIIILSMTNDPEIEKRCTRFFEDIDEIFNTYKNGLIRHGIQPKLSKVDNIKTKLKFIRDKYNKYKNNISMEYKENGYHLFNIYAFAIIKAHGYDINLFNNSIFKESLRYCFNNDLYEWLEHKERKLDLNSMPNVKRDKINIYGYSYNAPGFELPYIYKVFSKELEDIDEKFINNVIEKQINYTYDQNKISFCKNTEDPNTLEARLYEYIRVLTL